ncbi:hypothetical protein TVAG_137830 [Trichomonas vaginalis G3]|uniref:Uncharacterized protein n=1 Tax=Trichomonas vaginalis (strain ATCC PRA-98 / G3) TaxID=412133 RepID=A2EC16_TRIV3|nr:hypothetical protein TVAGG3_0269410 [Trichomonas vaginalis G3]EAY09791.1 hypothetical protein TVAG_137830 [Trichomonas vaginalis G3]KAI5525742.1 hypothetical protein TVAGG3_0269410 [Trichomonas vaginalis G3]|eukprot:XP_001322014.1 hypothetical protein [Trichomonas vaginalis G3]
MSEKRSGSSSHIYMEIKNPTSLHINEYEVFVPVSEKGLSVDHPKNTKTGEFTKIKPKYQEPYVFQPTKTNSKKTKQEKQVIQLAQTESFISGITALINRRLKKSGITIDSNARELVQKAIFSYILQIIKTSHEISQVRLDIGGDSNRAISFLPSISQYALQFENYMLTSARGSQFSKSKELTDFFKDHMLKYAQPIPLLKEPQSQEGFITLFPIQYNAEENALARLINVKLTKNSEDGVAQQFKDKINKYKSQYDENKRNFKNINLNELKKNEEFETRRQNPSILPSDIITCIQMYPNFEFISKQVLSLFQLEE